MLFLELTNYLPMNWFFTLKNLPLPLHCWGGRGREKMESDQMNQ